MSFHGPKASFDTIAEDYDAARPAYPDALVEAVVRRSGLPGGGSILEVGAGTGLATWPFAERGHSLLCLEPGANLAAVAARKLAPFPKVRFAVVSLEEWRPAGETFDLLTSAQAFHWIDPDFGFRKAASVLSAAGSLALFWNLSPDPDPGSLLDRINQTYFRWAPELAHGRGGDLLSAKVAYIEERLRAPGSPFCHVEVECFPWTQTLNTEQYLRLLNTYSNHLTLPPDQRKNLYTAIAELIRQHGGALEKEYVTTLLFARKSG